MAKNAPGMGPDRARRSVRRPDRAREPGRVRRTPGRARGPGSGSGGQDRARSVHTRVSIYFAPPKVRIGLRRRTKLGAEGSILVRSPGRGPGRSWRSGSGSEAGSDPGRIRRSGSGPGRVRRAESDPGRARRSGQDLGWASEAGPEGGAWDGPRPVGVRPLTRVQDRRSRQKCPGNWPKNGPGGRVIGRVPCLVGKYGPVSPAAGLGGRVRDPGWGPGWPGLGPAWPCIRDFHSGSPRCTRGRKTRKSGVFDKNGPVEQKKCPGKFFATFCTGPYLHFSQDPGRARPYTISDGRVGRAH